MSKLIWSSSAITWFKQVGPLCYIWIVGMMVEIEWFISMEWKKKCLVVVLKYKELFLFLSNLWVLFFKKGYGMPHSNLNGVNHSTLYFIHFSILFIHQF